jgi:ankyrin repeat protein
VSAHRQGRNWIPAALLVAAIPLGGCFLCPHPRDEYVDIDRFAINEDLPGVKADLELRPGDLNLPEEHGLTPLDLAVLHCMDDPEHPKTELVRFLLERGANPNPKENGVTTALHFAAQVGNAEVITMLVHKHARIDATDERGETPQQRAARFHNGAVYLSAIAAP